MTTTAQALEALATVAVADHSYNGLCPDSLQPESSDPECKVCQSVDALRQHIESTAAELARLQAECEVLRKDAEIGARWKANSSLEEWFPITAENMKALEKDAARLDYLDARNAAKNAKNGTPYGWRLTENHNRIALEDHNWPVLDVRAAIDAALSTSTAPSGAEE